MKKDGVTKKQELLLSIVIAALIVMGTILITGTFFTGFHFIDDHEFVKVGQMIREQGCFRQSYPVLETIFHFGFGLFTGYYGL